MHLIVDASGWIPPDAGFHAFSPLRIVESRAGAIPTVDGVTSGFGRLHAGSTLRVPIFARAGLRPQTGSVVLNVAAIDPSAAGFLTVHSCEDTRPLAASLNFAAHRTVSNTVVVGIPLSSAVFDGGTAGSPEL